MLEIRAPTIKDLDKLCKLNEKIFYVGKQKGLSRVWLSCYVGNKEAISFYKKKGFSEIDIGLERDI